MFTNSQARLSRALVGPFCNSLLIGPAGIRIKRFARSQECMGAIALRLTKERPMPRSRSSSPALREYQAKRNFQKTPEPSGKGKPKVKAADARPGEHFFCVQKHLASHLHYDFRLEHKGVLLSWAVPKGPSLNPADKRLAMRVEDHPLDYGDFEGVIPEGYGAGIVMLWDRGTWEPEVDDIDAALERGDLKFTLDGVKLKGSWVLVRTRGGPNAARMPRGNRARGC